MTTKTWDNSTNSFYSAADWSPSGAPQSGDTAIINGGTVGLLSALVQGLTIKLNGGTTGSPSLTLDSTTLATGTVLAIAATSGTIAISATGNIVNEGLITFNGPAVARFTTTLFNGSAGTPASLQNSGSIAAIDASPNMVATATGQAIHNDGAISIWNPSRGIQFALLGPAIDGDGKIIIDAYSRVELVQDIGINQIVQFLNGGAGQSVLQIDRAAGFGATIMGFAQDDTLTLANLPYTAFEYTSTSPSGGLLTLTMNGAPAASLAFAGTWQTSDFNLQFTDLGGGVSTTQITTERLAGAQIFHITDTALNVSTTDHGTDYVGPVSYLEHEFIWNDPDNVVIAATAANSFLHGGSGADALLVDAGQNVLDGGGGSNFLIGADGSDGGKDTFFLDGRDGRETWSTIVNFHQGDMVTLFGFNFGLSTMPFTALDGAAGYQGATLHSELQGAGTGVNASLTFPGLSLADVQNKLTITGGTVSGSDYLAIIFTG